MMWYRIVWQVWCGVVYYLNLIFVLLYVTCDIMCIFQKISQCHLTQSIYIHCTWPWISFHIKAHQIAQWTTCFFFNRNTVHSLADKRLHLEALQPFTACLWLSVITANMAGYAQPSYLSSQFIYSLVSPNPIQPSRDTQYHHTAFLDKSTTWSSKAAKPQSYQQSLRVNVGSFEGLMLSHVWDPICELRLVFVHGGFHVCLECRPSTSGHQTLQAVPSNVRWEY